MVMRSPPRNFSDTFADASKTAALKVVLEGGAFFVRATLNGKNYRKMLKTIDANGVENVAAVLQGSLRQATAGGTLTLDGAGLQVFVKQPKPAADGITETAVTPRAGPVVAAATRIE